MNFIRSEKGHYVNLSRLETISVVERFGAWWIVGRDIMGADHYLFKYDNEYVAQTSLDVKMKGL